MPSPSAPARVRCALPALAALVLAAVSLPGCPSTTPESTPDAAPDGPPLPPSMEVRCPAVVDGEIESLYVGVANYLPMSKTIRKGGVIRFKTANEHTARSSTNLWHITERSDTMCVKFNTVGTHEFFCNSHGFRGTIIVQ